MEKSKQELLDYSIQMRLRGDTYRDMLAYLKKYTNDEAVIKEIISKVDSLEKTKRIKSPERRTSVSSLSIVLGSIFIVTGIFLIIFLWERGFVASLPILLIVLGFYAFSGKMG